MEEERWVEYGTEVELYEIAKQHCVERNTPTGNGRDNNVNEPKGCG